MRNAELYRAGSVESPRARIRSRSLGNGLHHVRHVGWPAAVRDVDVSRDVLADRPQHVRDPSMGVSSGSLIDPPVAGPRPGPPPHVGSGAETRFLHQRIHARLSAAVVLLQSPDVRLQRQRNQVGRRFH